MPTFVQYRTNLTPGGRKLDGAVFAISPAGIIRFSSSAWSGKAPAGGGDAAAALYGGLHAGLNDQVFSRTLDANGVTWDDAMKAFDTSAFVAARSTPASYA